MTDHAFQAVGISAILLYTVPLRWLILHLRRSCRKDFGVNRCMAVTISSWVCIGMLFFALVGLFWWHALIVIPAMWFATTGLWMSHDKHVHELHEDETE